MTSSTRLFFFFGVQSRRWSREYIAQEGTATKGERDRVDRYTQKRRNIEHINVRRAVDGN